MNNEKPTINTPILTDRIKNSNITLVDVARLANVSNASVSRVLNNPAKVGEQIRKRVEEAIRRLGFVPNGAARALRSPKRTLVGAIIPSLNYTYGPMIEALQKRLCAEGISLVINTTDYYPAAEHEQATLLVERGVSAVILVGETERSRTLTLLREHNIHCVKTYTNSNDLSTSSVGFINSAAGAKVAQYLHALGHRHYAMIAGVSRHNSRVIERRIGFVDALGQLGIPSSNIQIAEVEYAMNAGYRAMLNLLKNHSVLTAVFCGSDVLAAGALKACEELNVSCPDEISIVGFDNLEFAEYLKPALTSVEVRGREIGLCAAEMVISLAENPSYIGRVELDAQLVIRASTGQTSLSPPHKALVDFDLNFHYRD